MSDKVKREVRLLNGVSHARSDEELVATYLRGYIDYEGGALEHLQQAVDNIADNAARLLLHIDREKVLELCEKKEAQNA